jgi:tripartite-type tricarboxylate transporter receptor subunit TctC
MSLSAILQRFALLLVALLNPIVATAQTFPTKPIRIIVPFAPGGSTDLTARLLAPKLQDRFGQPVIVDNRPGAGGSIAVELAATAPPDGHTLVVSAPGALTINMHFTKVSYDPLKDVAPVTRLVRSPLVLAVHASTPFKSINDLVTYAKAKPGALTFSSIGPFNLSFLAAELLKHKTSIDMVAVPYKGSAPASAAIASGEVNLGFMDTTGVMPFVQGGRVRLIATAESQRLLTLPDLPTIAESGVPGYEANSWLAMVTTGGTPSSVIARLNAEVVRALGAPDVRDGLLKGGQEPAPSSPDELRQMLRSDFEKWRTVIKERGIKAD